MDKEERQQATLHHHGKETKHRRILQQNLLFLQSMRFSKFDTGTFHKKLGMLYVVKTTFLDVK
jgi:hypothetical protein